MLSKAHCRDHTGTAAFLLVLVLLWMILTPYPGITHDGQGYAFQAMARLNPVQFGGDIFLKFQSQDDYTVFPLLQAVAINALGLDLGTSLLTILFQVAWFASAWLLLRQLLTPRLALLGLGLLVVMPGFYGAMRIFQFAEPFLTARLPAEALSLLGIALYLRNNYLLCTLALLAALLLHPLMALPAILLTAFLAGWRVLGPRSVGFGVALLFIGAILVSALLQFGQPVFDATWIELLRSRSPHLFTDLWTPLDWNSVAQVLATLAIVATCIEDPVSRRLSLTALAIGFAGLALTAAASVWPQLDLLLRGQPWRWLWLCRVLAIAMLPAVLVALWGEHRVRRAAMLMLASSWLIVLPVSARSGVAQAVPGFLAVAALGLAIAPSSQVSPRLQGLALRGSWLVLGVVAIAAALTTSVVATMRFADTSDPDWLRVLGNVANMTMPSVAAVAGAWYLAMRGSRAAAVAVLSLAAITIAAVSPYRAPTWVETPWSGTSRDGFADWRAQIPEQSEVLWWDGLREVWFLLQRRSYLTDSQAGGIVFSAELAVEIQRRAENLEPYVPATQWIAGMETGDRRAGLTAENFAAICLDEQLGFVVAEEDIGLGAPSHVWPARGTRVYLYDCSKVRGVKPIKL